jgi:hypothetical protein
MLDSPISTDDLRQLSLIGRTWVCSSYWDDQTIQRYHRLGLVARDGKQIRLTEAGRRATAGAAAVTGTVTLPAASYHPVTSYHPI